MLPNAAPENKELVYFPYWRFKGMLFSSTPAGIRYRFIDVSHQAIPSKDFPISVGLRSQTLKLKFILPEAKGRFLAPQMPLEQTIRIFEDRFRKDLPKPILHQSHIGETISLIYSPFYIEEKVYDAILNKPVSMHLSADFDATSWPDGRSGGQIRFIPALCPACGWELSGPKESLVLSCRNCSSLWEAVNKEFKKLNFAHIAGKEDDLTYLPFWRIKAKTSGITLDSYADLVRVANLPKAVPEGGKDMAFCFWAPAFKVRPQKFLSLSRNITLLQPREKLITELPEGHLHPVTLPVSEAIESLKINLAGFLKPPKTVVSKLPDIVIKPKSFALVFIPFVDKHHELVQPLFHQAVNKNQLSLAKNL